LGFRAEKPANSGVFPEFQPETPRCNMGPAFKKQALNWGRCGGETPVEGVGRDLGPAGGGDFPLHLSIAGLEFHSIKFRIMVESPHRAEFLNHSNTSAREK
jgi:hypothetical protein